MHETPILQPSGLNLNHWYRLMQYHPWHGYQLANNQLPVSSKCNGVVYERASNDADRAGRISIRDAIERAEQLYRQYARHSPAPRYRETVVDWPQLGDQRLVNPSSPDATGHWLGVQLPDGHIQAVGAKVESSLGTAALVYSDLDQDGIDETATATFAVSATTTADHLVMRFVASDWGATSPTDVNALEVAPRAIAIASGVATITFDAWTLVRPVRYGGFASVPLDPTAVGVLATEIEGLTRRCDPTGSTVATAQAVLIYESRPCPLAFAQPAGSDPAATRSVLARAVIRDSEPGILGIGGAVYHPSTGTWSSADWLHLCLAYPPDRVLVRYVEGLPRLGLQMQPSIAEVVARLAAAELARPICACEGANKALYEWQFDLSRSSGNELFQGIADISNPLGSRRGHVAAWRHLQQQQVVIGLRA